MVELELDPRYVWFPSWSPLSPLRGLPATFASLGGGGFLVLEDVWLMAEGLGGKPGPALALSLCLPVHSAIVHVSSGLLSRQRVRSPQVLGAHFSLLTSHSLKFASFYLCFFLKRSY